MPEAVTIQTQVILGSAAGPHLLITGGVHGDEFEPMAAIRRLIGLVASDELRGRLTLAPVVNEAAFARANRMAEDQLDLARVCPGKQDGSITEQTAHALAQLIRAADLYIDLHTGGSAMAIYPLAGYVLHRDSQVLETQRVMARAFNLPIVWGSSDKLEGRSLSVARDAGIPAIYAEFHGPGPCEAAAIEAYVSGCINVMAAMNMLNRPPPTPSVVLVVEDSRPESGHLQRSNPAPSAGFFEPAVKPGDWVHNGDLLGVLIVDPLGHKRLTISSGEAGIVLAVRACPAVQRGDSLAVILETSRETAS